MPINVTSPSVSSNVRVSSGEGGAPARPSAVSQPRPDRFESSASSSNPFLAYNPLMASMAFWQAAMNPMQFWMNTAIAMQIAARGPFAGPIFMGPFH